MHLRGQKYADDLTFLIAIIQIVAIGDGWSEGRLNEHCNTYVDRLSDRYGVLWAHLSSSSLTESILYDAWGYVVESGFLALLEGFSKISKCSTEGRALMSIDLATFSSNVNKNALGDRIGATTSSLCPPSVDPSRGMQYVGTYIKVFYFPYQVCLFNLSHLIHVRHMPTIKLNFSFCTLFVTGYAVVDCGKSTALSFVSSLDIGIDGCTQPAPTC